MVPSRTVHLAGVLLSGVMGRGRPPPPNTSCAGVTAPHVTSTFSSRAPRPCAAAAQPPSNPPPPRPRRGASRSHAGAGVPGCLLFTAPWETTGLGVHPSSPRPASPSLVLQHVCAPGQARAGGGGSFHRGRHSSPLSVRGS